MNAGRPSPLPVSSPSPIAPPGAVCTRSPSFRRREGSRAQLALASVAIGLRPGCVDHAAPDDRTDLTVGCRFAQVPRKLEAAATSLLLGTAFDCLRTGTPSREQHRFAAEAAMRRTAHDSSFRTTMGHDDVGTSRRGLPRRRRPGRRCWPQPEAAVPSRLPQWRLMCRWFVNVPWLLGIDVVHM